MGLSMKDTALAKYYINEGEKKGFAEGEKQKALEIAVKLLKKGSSVEDVADITGLSLEQVRVINERK